MKFDDVKKFLIALVLFIGVNYIAFLFFFSVLQQ